MRAPPTFRNGFSKILGHIWPNRIRIRKRLRTASTDLCASCLSVIPKNSKSGTVLRITPKIYRHSYFGLRTSRTIPILTRRVRMKILEYSYITHIRSRVPYIIYTSSKFSGSRIDFDTRHVMWFVFFCVIRGPPHTPYPAVEKQSRPTKTARKPRLSEIDPINNWEAKESCVLRSIRVTSRTRYCRSP